MHFYQKVSSSVSQDFQHFPPNSTRTTALVIVMENDSAQCAVGTVQQQLSSTANLGEISVANPLPCNDSGYFPVLCLSCRLTLSEEGVVTSWKIQNLKFLSFHVRNAVLSITPSTHNSSSLSSD
jgi:hypothetical protein